MVAGQYKNNRQEFERTAREWTATYAKDLRTVQEEKVKRLCEMGFEEGMVRDVLENTAWDEQMALNTLLG
jgi:ubiquitin-conjugating enzyme (huntingtin interacting protein 2)